MHPDLQRLIELQHLDSAAHVAERGIASEADRQRVLDVQIDSARQLVAAAKERLAENQNARRTIEKDVAVHQGRLSKFRDQLMAVKTNIDAQAMQKRSMRRPVKKLEIRCSNAWWKATTQPPQSSARKGRSPRHRRPSTPIGRPRCGGGRTKASLER
jgi:chromosome segregation ATPase